MSHLERYPRKLVVPITWLDVRFNHNLLLDNIKENKLWEPLRQYWLE